MKAYRRMTSLFVIMVFIFSFLIIRLMKLSTDNEIMTTAANNQSTYSLNIAKLRGNIYDCHMKKLVNNDVEYIASVSPSQTALTALKNNVTDGQNQLLLSQQKSGRPLSIKLQSPIQADGITTFNVFKRYKDNQLAPHIIGYINGDKEGVCGIEKVFNNRLNCGASIDTSYTVSATGTALSGIKPNISDTSNKIRQGVILTLDSDIQAIAQKAAELYLDSGAIVVMKVGSGDILASVSYPTYDPYNVAKYINDSRSPLLNRAFNAYNVGSVFKLVTAAAALENGFDDKSTYDCIGSISIGSNTFSCHKHSGHGTLNMTEATAKSCNPYYINVGQAIGGDKIYDMAVNLGFGKPIYLAEDYKTASGTLPEKSLLQGSAVTANFSFGQGELTATPIHLCSLINTIASYGEYYTPQLIKGTVDADGSILANTSSPPISAFSLDTSVKLQNMMQSVLTDDGTGAAARPYNTIAAGKTATAETGIIKDGKYIVQSWFGGFFPYTEPEYSIVVLAENTSDGKKTSCPAFKYIAENITEKLKGK